MLSHQVLLKKGFINAYSIHPWGKHSDFGDPELEQWELEMTSIPFS
jgi:hypothetical protein